jgi:uncharacterized small protein (DUF1192 family)
MDQKENIKNLTVEIEFLKEELREREQSLPAHSIRPHQLLAIEELEEKIKALNEKVRREESGLAPAERT